MYVYTLCVLLKIGKGPDPFIQKFEIEGGSDGQVFACSMFERSPGEGTATHSSILAWRILRAEDPGRLKSMGSQRVGHKQLSLSLEFEITL